MKTVLTKKDFEADFDYLLYFLKSYNLYSHLIKFEEIYKLKNKVCSNTSEYPCKNRSEFLMNLYNLVIFKFLNNIGHFDCLLLEDIEFNNIFYRDIPQFRQLLNNNLLSFTEIQKNIKDFNKYNIILTNAKDLIKHKNKKTYDCRIIKNDKNENVMYVKIRQMNFPTYEETIQLSNFIKENKGLNNIYIDIRGNFGGFYKCASILLLNIYNGYLGPLNSYELYLKYNNYTKPYYDFIFKNTKIKPIQLINNKNGFTHYINVDPIKTINYNSLELTGFNGNIYVIMDHYNYSAAQMFLDNIKGHDKITIYGNEKSAGYGIYSCLPIETTLKSINYYNYIYFILPKTNILMKQELFYYDKDKYLTEPDEKIPDFLMKKEFLD